MLDEVINVIGPRDGEIYVDCTFGAGGYSRALLETAHCRVMALDRDPTAIAAGQKMVGAFSSRLTLVESPFSDLLDVAHRLGLSQVDGVVMDIGVSSMQLDRPERGFSFLRDGPLDMRMSDCGPTAADVVNSLDEEALANVLYDLAEERRSRAIARAIVKTRREAPIRTTLELAALVERVLGRARGDEKHPATRTFQALRMYVNDELGELEGGLKAAEALLKPGGRLLVVSFHSLEDRIAKRFFNARSGKEEGVSRYLPRQEQARAPSFRIVNTRGFTPSEGETEMNPRARSARLRAGVRTDAAAWASDS